MNRDTLNHLPARRVANAAMTVVNALQDYPKEHQGAALAACFMLYSEFLGVSPQDLFTVANNVMNYSDGKRPEFNAVRAYLEGELKKN